MHLRNKLAYITIAMVILMGIAYPYFARPKINEHNQAIEYYQSIITHELAYLETTQLNNGAYAMRPRSDGEAYVNAYFANFTALAMMQGETDFSGSVQEYLTWFFLNINQSDPKHRAGSISDFTYTVFEDTIINQVMHEYDSVDAYLASFIMALQAYLIKSNDISLLIKYEEEWVSILKAFNATRNEANGLAMVSLSNPTQYLMDNSEVYGALKVVQDIFDLYWSNPTRNLSFELELRTLETDLANWKDAFKHQFSLFYDDEQAIYTYALDANGEQFETDIDSRLYPDGVSQLFPMLFGIDSPEDDKTKKLYASFNQNYSWVDFEQYKEGESNFYWFVIAYAAAMMNDEARLLAFLTNYQEDILVDHPYPIYNAEVAWVIMACDRMIDFHTRSMKTLDPLGLFH